MEGTTKVAEHYKHVLFLNHAQRQSYILYEKVSIVRTVHVSCR